MKINGTMGIDLTVENQRRRKWKYSGLVLTALFSILIAGCHTSIGNAKKQSAFTHNNIEYEIYSVTKFDEGNGTQVLALVKKGADPVAISGQAIITECPSFNANCERVFRNHLDRKQNVQKDSTRQPDGGDG